MRFKDFLQLKKIVSTRKVFIIITIPHFFFLPPSLSCFLLPYSDPFPSSRPLPLPSPSLSPFPWPGAPPPPLTLTASPAMSHGSLLPHWLPKASGWQRRTQARAGGGGCQARICQEEQPGAGLEILLGLEHAFMEPSAVILGNYKRPKVPEDCERINIVLPIFANRGERLILVILSRSFNIWETLPQVLSQPARARALG